MPTSVAVVPHETKADLTWAAPATDDATGYQVRVNGGAAVNVGAVFAHTFEGLSQSTSYTFEVRAYNLIGSSPWAMVIASTIAPTPTPGQHFDTVDVLALEVEGDPVAGKYRNLLINPDGALGGAGWVTPTPLAFLVDGSGKFTFSGIGPGEVYFTSDTLPAVPGQFVSVFWKVHDLSAGYYRVILDFGSQPDGTFASDWTPDSSVELGVPVGGGTMQNATGVDDSASAIDVPAGAVRMRVRVRLTSDSLGTTPPATRVFIGMQHMAVVSEGTGASIALADVVNEGVWLDVIGPSHEIAVTREELNLGTLTATVLDSSLDPAAEDALAPGRRVRLRVRTDELTDTWEPIFTGKVSAASVQYDLRYEIAHPGTAKGVRISLSAVDALSVLSAKPAPYGVPDVQDLGDMLEGAGVPWILDSSTGQRPAADPVSRNDNATVVDQIAITRDSTSARVWIDRTGRLVGENGDVWGFAGVAATLDEDTYSDLGVTFDSEAFINAVTLNFLHYDAGTDTTTEVNYGPYIDPQTYGPRGPHPATFTVHGISEDPADLKDFAESILAANAVAQVTAEKAQLPMRDQNDLSTLAVIDLCDKVDVVYTARGIDQPSRVTAIEHRISTTNRRGKWLMNLTFAPAAAVSRPQVAPPLMLTP